MKDLLTSTAPQPTTASSSSSSTKTPLSTSSDSILSNISPRKWLNAYETFITKNAGAVGQVEGALRSLVYIIPGRFNDAEIASESLNSGVQVLGLWHDALLSKAASSSSSSSSGAGGHMGGGLNGGGTAQKPRETRQHQSPHTRYTRFYCQRKTYRRTATLLQVVQYTELLLEMGAKRRGEKTRWRVVVLLEIVKAVCRLVLMQLTNSRPLLSPPLPEREAADETTTGSSSEEEEEGSTSVFDEEGASSGTTTASTRKQWTMPRTSLTLPPLPGSQDISSYLLSKVLTADDIKPPKALMPRVSGLGEVAEVMYILRPVIYAAAMAYWCQQRNGEGKGKGKADWRPWLLGFSIEYAARQLAKRDLQTRRPGGARGLTALEKEEMKKRGWAMAWWVMRGAFYENVTKGLIGGFASRLKGKPVLDLVGTFVEDYEFLWDTYYMSTATM